MFNFVFFFCFFFRDSAGYMCWEPVHSVYEHFKLDVQAWRRKGHAYNKPPQCFMHILMSFSGTGDAACLRSELIKAEEASRLFPLQSWQLLQKSLLHPCWGFVESWHPAKEGPSRIILQRTEIDLNSARQLFGVRLQIYLLRVVHGAPHTHTSACTMHHPTDSLTGLQVTSKRMDVCERVLLQTTFLPDFCRCQKEWRPFFGLYLTYTCRNDLFHLSNAPNCKNKPIWWKSDKLVKCHKLLQTLFLSNFFPFEAEVTSNSSQIPISSQIPKLEGWGQRKWLSCSPSQWSTDKRGPCYWFTFDSAEVQKGTEELCQWCHTVNGPLMAKPNMLAS